MFVSLARIFVVALALVLGFSAQAVQDTLLSGVNAFTGPEPQVDDITLMVLIRDQALGIR